MGGKKRMRVQSLASWWDWNNFQGPYWDDKVESEIKDFEKRGGLVVSCRPEDSWREGEKQMHRRCWGISRFTRFCWTTR